MSSHPLSTGPVDHMSHWNAHSLTELVLDSVQCQMQQTEHSIIPGTNENTKFKKGLKYSRSKDVRVERTRLESYRFKIIPSFYTKVDWNRDS